MDKQDLRDSREGNIETICGNGTPQETAGLSQEIVDLQVSIRAEVELEEESNPKVIFYREIWEKLGEDTKRRMPWSEFKSAMLAGENDVVTII